MASSSTWSTAHGSYVWSCPVCGDTGYDYEGFAEAEAVRRAHTDTHTLRPVSQ